MGRDDRIRGAALVGLFAAGCAAPGDDPDAHRFRDGDWAGDGQPVALDEDLALQISPAEGKAPLNSKLRAAPVDAEASILWYEWDFGDGVTSTEAEPEHIFDDPGRYDVTLTAELDLNHVAIGMTEVVEATVPVYATATEWKGDEVDAELTTGWTRGGGALVCASGVDCDPLRMRLPGAPDGLWDLTVRLDYRPESSPEPQPHFELDGVEYNLVPDEGDDTGLVFTELKTVVVSNHEVELLWDDVDQSRIHIAHVVLNPAEGYENPDVEISASVDMGELPLKVEFDVDSNVDIESYRWTFGDGKESSKARPSHKYKTMGRMDVALHFEDSAGVAGLATTVVTVKPSKVELPGLENLNQVGIWSAGFRNDADEFNERRRAELEAMNVTFVGPGGVSGKKYVTSEGAAANIHETLELHAARGIRTGAEVVQKHDWYINDDDGQPRDEWVFDTTAAQTLLSGTDWDGDGVSDLEGHVGWVYLGHEMGEYASRADRAQMVALTRQWFPDTPIYPYYGGISRTVEQPDLQHPAGGVNAEYQVGDGDSDIIGLSISGPFAKLADGERVFDPGWSRLQMQKHAGAALHSFDAPRLWVNTNLPGESASSTVESMWSAEQILDYARVLLSAEVQDFLGAGGVESLSFRAYDRFEFDLGYGANTENPEEEEYGFIEQREAVRWIGGWVKQMKADLPILIVRQPEMQQTRKGPHVDVEYAIIGEQTELAEDVVVQLDDRPPVHDPDLDGVVRIEDVEVGTHTVFAHLEDGNRNIIPGTDLRVLSVHVIEGDPEPEDTDGAEGGSGGGSDTDGSSSDDQGSDDAGSAGSATDWDPPASDPETARGCGCRATQPHRGRGWGAAFLLSLLLATRRRWRS